MLKMIYKILDLRLKFAKEVFFFNPILSYDAP